MKKLLSIIILALFLTSCKSGVTEPEKINLVSGVWVGENITLYLLQSDETHFEGDFYFNKRFISKVNGKIIGRNYLFSTSQNNAYECFSLGFNGTLRENKLTGFLSGSVYSNNTVYMWGNVSTSFYRQN